MENGLAGNKEHLNTNRYIDVYIAGQNIKNKKNENFLENDFITSQAPPQYEALSEFKKITTDLEKTLKDNEITYNEWLNDYANPIKQNTYWDTIDNSRLLTDKLLSLTNSHPDILNSSLKKGICYLKQAASIEKATYLAWENGDSWMNFYAAIIQRLRMCKSFINIANKTQAFDIEEDNEKILNENKLKIKLSELENALNTQDKTLADWWYHDRGNYIKQKDYWDAVTNSRHKVNDLISFINSSSSSSISAPIKNALYKLKKATLLEDTSYSKWKNGDSWNHYNSAMQTRFINTRNFVKIIRQTHFANA